MDHRPPGRVGADHAPSIAMEEGDRFKMEVDEAPAVNPGIGRAGGTRRCRGLTLPELLENGDIAPVILSYLEMSKIVCMSAIDKSMRGLCLTDTVQEVSSETLGSHRLHFLQLLGRNGVAYTGIRRVFLNRGLDEDSHVALCEMFRSGACPRLETLDLSESSVTDGRVLRLMQSIQKGRSLAATRGGSGATGTGPSLQDLRLNNNPIGNAGVATLGILLREHLPTLRHLHLTRLRVTSSGLGSLFRSLTSSSVKNRLKTFAFSTCLVAPHELNPLFESLLQGGFCHLVSLDLKYLPLRDDGTKQLATCLQQGPCPSLESLTLARTQMGRVGLESLAASISSTAWAQRLSKLDISGNLLGHEMGAYALSHAMRRGGLRGLGELCMAESGLNPEAFGYVFGALHERACPQLRLLDVSNNLVGDVGTFQLLSALTPTRTFGRPAMPPPPPSDGADNRGSQLEVLNLANCCLQTTAIVALGSTLEGGFLSRLCELRVGDESSWAGGLCTLTEALRQGSCPSLQTLALTSLRHADVVQSIGAVAALADAIEGPLSRTLRVLQLCRIFVGPSVALAMGKALLKARRLEVLQMEGGELGATGVKAISHAFAEGACPRLTSLSLSGNDAGDEGMAALGAALSPANHRRPHGRCSLPYLKTLRLARNRISSHGMCALASALRAGACHRLIFLDLDENPLGDKGIAVLMASLVPNPGPAHGDGRRGSGKGAERPSKRHRTAGAPTAAGSLDNKADGDDDDDDDDREGGGLPGFLPSGLSHMLQSAGRGLKRLLRWGAMRQHADGAGGGL